MEETERVNDPGLIPLEGGGNRSPAFDDLARAFQIELRRAMTSPGKRRLHLFTTGSPSPELRRVLARIDRYTSELRRLHDANARPGDFDIPRVRDLFMGSPSGMDVLTAWVVADDLKFEVLDRADDAYLGVLLAREAGRQDPLPEMQVARWTDCFAEDELAALMRAFQAGTPTEEQRRRARACLRSLYLRSAELGNLGRARQETRARYLVRWTQVLLPLVVSLGLALYGASVSRSSFWRLMVVGFAGAFGSTLSGVLQVRGLTRITALRSVRAGLFTQPLVGAAASLFIFALLASHLLVLPGTNSSTPPDWPALATYGFLAGFSEPFFFGAVRRITSSSEPAGATRGAESREQG